MLDLINFVGGYCMKNQKNTKNQAQNNMTNEITETNSTTMSNAKQERLLMLKTKQVNQNMEH